MEHDTEPTGPDRVPEPLAALDTVAERPLTEQVAVFEAVHEHLSARLADTED